MDSKIPATPHKATGKKRNIEKEQSKTSDKATRIIKVDVDKLKQDVFINANNEAKKNIITCFFCKMYITTNEKSENIEICQNCGNKFCGKCVYDDLCSSCTNPKIHKCKCQVCNKNILPLQTTHLCKICRKVLCIKCSNKQKCCTETWICENCENKCIDCKVCGSIFCDLKCKNIKCLKCKNDGCKKCSLLCNECNKSFCKKCSNTHTWAKCSDCNASNISECNKCGKCDQNKCKSCLKICECCSSKYCLQDILLHNPVCNDCGKMQCCSQCNITEHNINMKCSVCKDDKNNNRQHMTEVHGCHIETCSTKKWLAYCCKHADKHRKVGLSKFPVCKYCKHSYCLTTHIKKCDDGTYCCGGCTLVREIEKNSIDSKINSNDSKENLNTQTHESKKRKLNFKTEDKTDDKSKDKIIIGRTMEITGGDTTQARPLYRPDDEKYNYHPNGTELNEYSIISTDIKIKDVEGTLKMHKLFDTKMKKYIPDDIINIIKVYTQVNKIFTTEQYGKPYKRTKLKIARITALARIKEILIEHEYFNHNKHVKVHFKLQEIILKTKQKKIHNYVGEIDKLKEPIVINLDNGEKVTYKYSNSIKKC